MKKLNVVMLMMVLMYGLSGVVKAQSELIFSDDFEDGNIGNQVVCSNAEGWTTEETCGNSDPHYVDDFIHYGTKSVKVGKNEQGESYLEHQMYNLTSGKYKIEAWFYVPEGSGGGAFAITRNIYEGDVDTTWAFGVFYDEFQNRAFFRAGSNNEWGNWAFRDDTWIYNELYVDMDNDRAVFISDGVKRGDWTWSECYFPIGGPDQNELGTIFFGGYKEGLDMYVDDVKITELDDDWDVWTGNENSNWHNAANWMSNSIPNQNVDVVVPFAFFQPTISSGSASCRDLTIEGYATLFQLGEAYTTMKVYGSLNTSHWNAKYTMSGSKSYLKFYGDENAYWSDKNSNDTYQKVIISKSNLNSKVSIGEIEVQNYLKIYNGTLDIRKTCKLELKGSNTRDLCVYGDGKIKMVNGATIKVAGGAYFYNNSHLDISGGYFEVGKNFKVENITNQIAFNGGTLSLSGSVNQYIGSTDPSKLVLNNLSIDKTAGSCFLSTDLYVNGQTIINNKGLILKGHTLKTSGNITIDDGGYLYVNENAKLKIKGNKTLKVNSGGAFWSIGSNGKEASVTHNNVGNYYFKVESGATIGSKYTTFDFMGGAGINVKSGAFVNTSYSFNNCTFSNGAAGFNTALLTINNAQNISIVDATFPVQGLVDYNVSKTLNQGKIILKSANGAFAGEGNDRDFFNLIQWDIFGDNGGGVNEGNQTKTLAGSLEIESIIEDPNVSIFPNPTSDYVNIKFDESAKREVFIMNMVGKTIVQKIITHSNENIDLSGFESGVYFIRIQTGDKVYSSKIIKK